MRHLISLLAILLVFGCSQPQTDSKEFVTNEAGNKSEPTVQQTSPTFDGAGAMTLAEYRKKAVLIGDTITVFDAQLQIIHTLTNVSGNIVQIISRFNISFSEDDEGSLCDQYPYVRVQFDTIDGLVSGKYVYEFMEAEKHHSVDANDTHFRIIRTRNFGVGASNNEELTGCDEFYPLLIMDGGAGKFTLIEQLPGPDNHRDFPYTSLTHNDGRSDEINEVIAENKHLVILISMEFQDGTGSYELLINDYDSNRPTAEIRNYHGY